MKYSLILATVGRVPELDRFLRSVRPQSQRDLEVIVVDQNPDDRLNRILRAHRDDLPIRYVKSAPGLSRARNVGLSHVSGDVVTFPDDDCWYPQDLLGGVSRFLSERPEWDGITGRIADAQGVPWGPKSSRRGPVTRLNVWRKAISCAIFLRAHVVRTVGFYDESLGAGAPWGSGEETDYVLRALAAGFRLYYEPTITVHHDPPPAPVNCAARTRGHHYGLGMGKVLRKHRYPWWYVAYPMLLSAGRSLKSLLQGRPQEAAYHWAVLRGRWHGWRATGRATIVRVIAPR